MRSLRIRFAAIAVAAMLPATVAACGGSSSSSASSRPPKQVLKQTFSNPKSIDSGKLGINLSADVQGSQSGNFTADISGPFQGSTGSTQFPQLDLTAKVSGSGGGSPSISFEGALITTNSNAYIEYQGTAYQVPTQLYDRFKSAYQQQAQAGQAAQSGSSTSSIFNRLGIDPTTWLTNESNDGTTDVDGTTTIHISGDADVGKIITDLTKVAQSVPGASGQGISPSASEAGRGCREEGARRRLLGRVGPPAAKARRLARHRAPVRQRQRRLARLRGDPERRQPAADDQRPGPPEAAVGADRPARGPRAPGRAGRCRQRDPGAVEWRRGRLRRPAAPRRPPTPRPT